MADDELDEALRALESGRALQWTPEGVQVVQQSRPLDPGDQSIAEPLTDADGEQWLFVETPDDPDFEFDLEVGYSDVFAHERDAEVDESLTFLRSLPGVRSAFRQDPEQILVIGTRDARRIQASLLAWWSERL